MKHGPAPRPPTPGRPRRGRKHLVAMVGLPARGKTFTARKLAGYLSWLGYPTRTFNVGEARRREIGTGQTHEYFDPANRDAARERRALAERVLDLALAWLDGEGRIAIYDATNSRRAYRDEIRRRCAAQDRDLLFIEIVNEEPEVIEENVRATKLSSPDYAGVDAERALHDFRARIEHYRAVYEPLAQDEPSWVRLVDRGREVVIHEVHGWIPARIVGLLSNLQVSRRPVWLTRHGQSTYNVARRIGGDPELAPAGWAYARALADRACERLGGSDLDVWTSTLRRAIQTAEPTARALGIEPGPWRALDEIGGGICEGLTYAEIAAQYPTEYAARQRDKLNYRYPRGESYRDVIQRLDRLIVELERYRTPILVVTHRAVARALTAYFLQLPVEDAPYVSIPLHTVIELTPTAYGCDEARTPLPPAVSESPS